MVNIVKACQMQSNGTEVPTKILRRWVGKLVRAWALRISTTLWRIYIGDMEHERVDAHRELLEYGWTAYMQVPDALKRELGLEDGGEGLANGVNGIN